MKALNSTSEICVHLAQSFINLACSLTGVGLLIYGVFMATDYPGEAHDIQIIGLLLMMLGGQK